MQTEPIHLHDSEGTILCDRRHDQGVLTLSTHMAVMTSCWRCLGALDQSCFTPIADDEMEALVRRARGTLARAIPPLSEYLAEREAEYRRHLEIGEALRELHWETPRRRFLLRARIRRVIRRHDTEYT